MPADDVTKPFELVDQFAAMQADMRPRGGGLGPYGRQQRPRLRTDAEFVTGLGAARRPAQLPGGGVDLVDWGGRKLARSVVPYAEQISRMFPGLRFTSGHRDSAANARANGVPTSWHLQGRAMDFSGSAKDMQNAAAWARQNGAREVLIHNAGSGTHLHVAF